MIPKTPESKTFQMVTNLFLHKEKSKENSSYKFYLM